MRGSAHDDDYDELEPEWEGGTLSAHLETESAAEVECPYCGEVVELVVDKAGGAIQDYVQDCEVCCQPWQVHVSLGVGGAVDIRVERSN